MSFESEKHLFGVFDGHGGGEVAKYTKSHFEELLVQVEEYKQADYKEGLRKGFLKVDESLNNGGLEEVAKTKRDNPPQKSALMKILTDVTKKKSAAEAAAAAGGEGGEDTKATPAAEDSEDLQLDSIGCTANVVMVDYSTNKIFVANAGDSRCIMGKGGQVVPLSFDHKPESEVEIARIEAAGSRVTEGRVDGHLNLTRALGDLKFKKKEELKAEDHPITANPDVYEYEFSTEADFILMGCDGVWETKSNEEMCEWVYRKLEEAPDRSIASLKSIVSDLLNELISPNH